MAKILIIDDEAAILNLMSKSCRQQGHDVTAVQTGKDGIKALDAFRPDLMIVDLLIGDMNGLDIIRYSEENYPSTQVIMVTGNASVETAVEAMRLGAFDYLTKPFELADLQRTVEVSLQQPNTSAAAPFEQFQSAAITINTGEMVGESPKVKDCLLYTSPSPRDAS